MVADGVLFGVADVLIAHCVALLDAASLCLGVELVTARILHYRCPSVMENRRADTGEMMHFQVKSILAFISQCSPFIPKP